MLNSLHCAGREQPLAAKALISGFQLDLVPTDPKWASKTVLYLQGHVLAGYPAASSLEILALESKALQKELCQLINTIFAAEIKATAGR